MNREHRHTESRAQGQKTTKPSGTVTALPHRPFALWTVGVFVAFAALFGLWSINAATVAAAKEKVAIAPTAVDFAPSHFVPDLATPAPVIPDTHCPGNPGVPKARDLKKGDSVLHNGRWLTVANVESKTAEATPEPSSPQPILEADLKLDLSKSNGGCTFDVGRIAPCSQKVLRTNGQVATVGNLGVGDYICMTGDNVGRVVSISKKWHTRTPPQYDANGNGLNRVIATTKRMTDRLLYLYTSVELVETTSEHPFSVKGKGYVEAGRLQPGDVLETQDGKVVMVERTEARNEPQLVYNLEVENAHNFFVGKNAMLVYNGGGCVPGTNLDDLMGKTGLKPTQTDVNADNVNQYAEAMRNGTWDWNKTANDPLSPMIKDSEGRILAGHHRFVAAELAGVKIPDGVVKVLSRPTAGRPTYNWSDIQVLPGFKGARRTGF